MISTNANIPANLIDAPQHEDGYVDLKGEDTSDNFCALPFVLDDFPNEWYVEPKDWGERAEELDELKLWPEDTRASLGRFTNQSPTHECTCHSLAQGFEAASRAQLGYSTRNGMKGNICVSPLSIYAEANPRIRGGANCISVLKIAGRRGFLPEPIRGQDDIFEHTLHGTAGKGAAENSAGKWVAFHNFPSGHEETSKHLRVLEAVTPRSVEQACSMIFNRRVVNVGRKGHAVPWAKVLWQGGFDKGNPFRNLVIAYTDSYEVVRYDSYSTARRAISGASCITLVTTCEPFEDKFYEE